MQFSCQLTQRPDGQWTARHSGAEAGTVAVTAATREAALEKMRNELRYRLEFCPCTGELYHETRIELITSAGAE